MGAIGNWVSGTVPKLESEYQGKNPNFLGELSNWVHKLGALKGPAFGKKNFLWFKGKLVIFTVWTPRILGFFSRPPFVSRDYIVETETA